MKFPRNARILRGQSDAAPFATVFFLLVLFMVLGSLVYTPGVHIQLPVADGLPGTDKVPVRLAMDANGQFYFENKSIEENELRRRLRKEVQAAAPEPASLVVQFDKDAKEGMLTKLMVLAQEAGFAELTLATLPRSGLGGRNHSKP